MNCPECGKEMDDILNPEKREIVGAYCVECKKFVEAPKPLSSWVPAPKSKPIYAHIGVYSNDDHAE